MWRLREKGETMPRQGNLFRNLPNAEETEAIQILMEEKGVSIERIVSKGERSPEGFWYDQERSEWVLVLRGRGRLLFEEGGEEIEMGPGDWVEIPAHCRHRVEWTAPGEETLWLAVHYSPEKNPFGGSSGAR